MQLKTTRAALVPTLEVLHGSAQLRFVFKHKVWRQAIVGEHEHGCLYGVCVGVQARVKGRLGQSQVAHYNLDRLGVQHALHLPSVESTPGSSGNIHRFQTLQDNMPDMPDDVKQRLTSLLAAEFSKKVQQRCIHAGIRHPVCAWQQLFCSSSVSDCACTCQKRLYCGICITYACVGFCA